MKTDKETALSAAAIPSGDHFMKRIFAVNLGSTSTKVAYYEDTDCILKDTIRHSPKELAAFDTVFDQKELRQEKILAYMEEHGIDLDSLDAFVTRGPQTEPVRGGVYRINEAMISQAVSGDYGVHVCSVGSLIANDLTKGRNAIPMTADIPTTDEFRPLARYSGLKEIQRVSSFQALNQRAMAKFYAESIGKKYEDLNLVVAMLGGGISVVAHEHGVMIDGPDGLTGDGAFSNNRSCGLPAGPLVRLCYSGRYDLEGMLKHINGEGGLVSYLGTTDIPEILERIENGDDHAREVLEAMCYQTAKDIGAYATVLMGRVDAVILTGGMANSEFITSHIRERVGFIAPVVILPGEREMEALCLNAYDALTGVQELQEFIPAEQ